MRISEEIDALEVMGLPSMPYLVTTRMIAAFIAVIPLYVVGLFSSYFATQLIVTKFFGQSAGTYHHYFYLFLPPQDVIYSFLKVADLRRRHRASSTATTATTRAAARPAWASPSVAVRTAIVAINIVDLLLSVAIWGANNPVRIAG